jgi:U3 small nucleolar RNA-associated protein 7
VPGLEHDAVVVARRPCHTAEALSPARPALNPCAPFQGVDGQVKVWDVRTFKPLHAYFANAPATTLDISQKGLLAVGQGRRLQVRVAGGGRAWSSAAFAGRGARAPCAPCFHHPAPNIASPLTTPTPPPALTPCWPQIWRGALASKAQAPYLTHNLSTGAAACLRFCPFEDILGAGAALGYSSVLAPGAGEPNIDSFLANPYASRKERQEAEVQALLDKLQPDTIVLDPDGVGKVGWRLGAGFGCGPGGEGAAGEHPGRRVPRWRGAGPDG